MSLCINGCGRRHRNGATKTNCTHYRQSSQTSSQSTMSSSLQTKSVLTKKRAKPQVLDSINPTGTIFTEYDPESRVRAELAPNMTTLAETAEIPADEKVTIYRGHPADVQSTINPGDFITTNKQLAQDYAGNGVVTSMVVRADEILDDRDEPCGEEYLYRPNRER